jgi:hypothetical protein
MGIVIIPKEVVDMDLTMFVVVAQGLLSTQVVG